MKEVKEYIENNYNQYALENTYHNYDSNPRLDDCFSSGYSKGYSQALYDIGKILGINLELPENYEEE